MSENKQNKIDPWDGLHKMIHAVPTNWLDSLLTGPDKVIGDAPYNNQDIERLLQAISERMENIVKALKSTT